MDNKEILIKIAEGRATRAEIAEFTDFVSNLSEQEYNNLLLDYEEIMVNLGIDIPFEEDLLGDVHRRIQFAESEHRAEQGRVVSLRSQRWWVAASVVAVLGLAGYFLVSKFSSGDQFSEIGASTVQTQTDIAPGGNKAILTLADGTKIILDSANNGAISTQGNITVIKLGDGELSYQPETPNLKPETHNSQPTTYNTITTPRGGQYQLVLADGSKVWLNAASSLTYSTAFAGNERKVTLTGEGYFEVAHDASKPFFVSTGAMDIKVLGTHFNVNAYGDDGQLQTTLLEGSVEVSNSGNSVVIKPGQQVQVNKGGVGLKIVDHVDLGQVVAWKEGVFYFNKNNIREVMNQLARWYDVSITYEGTFSGRTFSGQMKRDLKLSQVMKILEYNNIKYQIIGKQMIISP